MYRVQGFGFRVGRGSVQILLYSHISDFALEPHLGLRFKALVYIGVI